MSAPPPEPRRVRGTSARPYTLRLDAERVGTLLGAVAWVLGALQIMRDRGHAEASEELHELQERLTPRLERLLNDVAVARQSAEREADAELGERVETAYTQVREAFERWIRLTASDTASVAIGQRLADLADDGEAGVRDAGES